MFSEVIAMIYLAPKLNSFIVGVEIGAEALEERFRLGLGIDGLRLQFAFDNTRLIILTS